MGLRSHPKSVNSAWIIAAWISVFGLESATQERQLLRLPSLLSAFGSHLYPGWRAPNPNALHSMRGAARHLGSSGSSRFPPTSPRDNGRVSPPLHRLGTLEVGSYAPRQTSAEVKPLNHYGRALRCCNESNAEGIELRQAIVNEGRRQQVVECPRKLGSAGEVERVYIHRIAVDCPSRTLAPPTPYLSCPLAESV